MKQAHSAPSFQKKDIQKSQWRQDCLRRGFLSSIKSYSNAREDNTDSTTYTEATERGRTFV